MPNIIIFIVVVVALLNVIAQAPKRTKAQPEPNRTKPNQTGEHMAQLELIEALQMHIAGLEDERNRLSEQCEHALDTKNMNRFEQNAKKIDRLTEQIARKKLQIAKLESKVNR